MKPERMLIANRGEIACRAVAACQKLGITSVVTVSEADRNSKAATLADEVVEIGPAPAAKSYMNIDAVLAAGLTAGVQAVYPGYGFLAENAEFAQRCVDEGLVFVGPKPEHILTMGDKGAAKDAARRAGVAVGDYSPPIANLEEALSLASGVAFPILIKAVAGGGGRGMRRVDSISDLASAFEAATNEAAAVFGDGTVYFEAFIQHARHIEVQIVGDSYGTVVHLGERDCSVQRRFQKVIEEAPPVDVPSDIIDRMRQDAVALTESVGYENVGTVEFVYDQAMKSYFFIEMNTRIQVEHPVTEMLWDVDLVAEQILLAGGARLSGSIRRASAEPDRHVIECRINCEDPARGFMPSPGVIDRFHVPERGYLRVDSHVFNGYIVPPFYDSLLAKVLVAGTTRAQAIERMLAVLEDVAVVGVATNLDLHRRILKNESFVAGQVHTRWLEDEFGAGAAR